MRITFNNSIYRPIIQKPAHKIPFKGFECDECDFEIKRLYDIPCPCCSVPMMQRNQIDAFVANVQGKTGQDLINILAKYHKYFHTTEGKVADLLMSEAQKYSDKNISELAQNYIDKKIEKIKREQLEAIAQIEKLTSGLQQTNQKNKIKLICEKCKNEIKNGGFVDKDDLEKEIEKHIQGQRAIRKKIAKLAQNMQTIQDEELLFLSKYAHKTQAELASRFVTPSFVTCEHIKPKSSGGEDNTENYLAECEECNSKRNNTPFNEWTSAMPNFASNFGKYIRILAQKIQLGRVPSKYATYLDDVTATVTRETQGKINIKAPTIEIKQEEEEIDINAKIIQIKKTIESLTQMLQELKDSKEGSSSIEQAYVDEYTMLKLRISGLKRQKQEKDKDIDSKRGALTKYYKDFTLVQKHDEQIEQFDKEKHTPRERGVFETKVKKARIAISSKNPEEMEEQLKIIEEEQREIQTKIEECKSRIAFLESKIVFPEKIKVEIRKAKARILEISEKKERIAELQKLITKNPDIEAQIEEKNKELHSLLNENDSINTDEDTAINIETYRDMTSVLERLKDLRYTKEQGTKTQKADNLIYKLAEEKANEVIEELYKTSGLVRHKINLDKITQLSSELNELNIIASKKQEYISELEDLTNELATSKTEEELTEEIKTLTTKLKKAEERFESGAIDAKIKKIKQDIKTKEIVLGKLEKGNLSNEEVMYWLTQL